MFTVDFFAVLEPNVVSPFVNFQALKIKYQFWYIFWKWSSSTENGRKPSDIFVRKSIILSWMIVSKISSEIAQI